MLNRWKFAHLAVDVGRVSHPFCAIYETVVMNEVLYSLLAKSSRKRNMQETDETAPEIHDICVLAWMRSIAANQ